LRSRLLRFSTTELARTVLAGRSLLADPRRSEVRDRLNRLIKHREPIGPFSASVLVEDAAYWLQVPDDPPGAVLCRDLMMFDYPVRPERAVQIPAVVHRDGTCRVQLVDRDRAPLYHALITMFREPTGVPLVLKTSFNDQEPLAASPDDALKTFARAHIDALFLGRPPCQKSAMTAWLRDFIRVGRPHTRSPARSSERRSFSNPFGTDMAGASPLCSATTHREDSVTTTPLRSASIATSALEKEQPSIMPPIASAWRGSGRIISASHLDHPSLPLQFWLCLKSAGT